jgi:HPt (histidine-containing phosphotransfer) domain-containing protein
MPVDEDDVRLRLTQLAERFLQRARTEAATLHAMIESAYSGDAVITDQLEQLAHRIHGSGMTFGFLAVGECAAEIEYSIEEFKLAAASSGMAMEPKLRQRLFDCARQLAEEIEVAAAH